MYAACDRPSAVASGTQSLTRRERVVALAQQGPNQPAPRFTAEIKLPQSVCGCAWSSDGELALATGREFACVYYVDTEETAYRLPSARAEHTTWLCGAFHPEDSRWIALGGTHCYLEVVHRRLWWGRGQGGESRAHRLGRRHEGDCVDVSRASPTRLHQFEHDAFRLHAHVPFPSPSERVVKFELDGVASLDFSLDGHMLAVAGGEPRKLPPWRRLVPFIHAKSHARPLVLALVSHSHRLARPHGRPRARVGHRRQDLLHLVLA